MNPRLSQLLDVVNISRRRLDVATLLSRPELVDALALISAPYSLEAASQYCGRLVAIVDEHPELLPSDAADAAARIGILQEVARAGDVDPYFAGSHLPLESNTPLQPWSGDGPLCDVLVLDARRPHERPQFHAIAEWFVGLCLRYHHRWLAPETYQRYIDGDGAPDSRLNRERGGSAIAAAGCAIRHLDDPNEYEVCEALRGLGLELGGERGAELARLASQVHRVPRIGAAHVRQWMRISGHDESRARDELEVMRNVVPGTVRHVLRLIWGRADERGPALRRHMRSVVRHYSQSRVTRSHGITENIVIEDPDDDASPVSLTVYEDQDSEQNAIQRQKLPRDAWVDTGEDPDAPAEDELYHLYVGTARDDPIAAYYKAKGARYAMEYENAMLPWARNRLGTQALQFLVQALHVNPSDSLLVRASKVMVLLSLLTGRTLTSVRIARIALDAPSALSTGAVTTEPLGGADVVVSTSNATLYVLAAAPDLKPRSWRIERPLAYPRGGYLALPLPTWARDLVGDGSWLGGSQLDVSDYVSAGWEWLKSLPPHFGIDAAAVRAALPRVLLQHSHGDLGIVKLICNPDALNFRNVIHYAAYAVVDANMAWSRAVAILLGSAQNVAMKGGSRSASGPRVGTPDALNVALLRNEFRRLRERLRNYLEEAVTPHVSDGTVEQTSVVGSADAMLERTHSADAAAIDPAIRAHNLLTLYTILWLNLATVTRSAVEPAPVALIGDVALVADKHRPDSSTDRLVPLSEGVMAQLKAYFAYIRQLAFRFPQFRPIADEMRAGVLRFQFLHKDGKVTKYRPSWLYEDARLIPMPGNWARKLVQQQMTDTGGRFLDAGMGHWVVGRHPYRLTSNFSFREFKDAWLGGQRRLEQQLGFTVIAHPALSATAVPWPVARPLRSPWRPRPPNAGRAPALVASDPNPDGAAAAETAEARSSVSAASVTAGQQLDDDEGVLASPSFDFDAECQAVDVDLYDELCASSRERFNGSAAKGEARASARAKLALGLIHKLAKHHGERKPDIREYVEQCCIAACNRWRVLVFATAPRQQFQHDAQTDMLALYNLAYFEERVLPAVHADLERLPPPRDVHCADEVDLGRFIFLCIWRQGLVTWPVLDAFLQSYQRQGVLATGPLRYVPSQVRCRRNGAQMERLVYLEPYMQVYLVAEAERVRAGLRPLFAVPDPQVRAAHADAAPQGPIAGVVEADGGSAPPGGDRVLGNESLRAAKKSQRSQNPQRRRGQLQAALRQYLMSLRLPGAGFDSLGSLLTLTLNAARQYHMLHGSPVLAAYAAAEFETHDLPDAEIRHLAGYPVRMATTSRQSIEESLEATTRDWLSTPRGTLRRDQDVVQQLAYHRTPYFNQLREAVAAVDPLHPLAALLKLFALWYLDRQAKPTGDKLDLAEKRRFQRTIGVVGYALLGFSDAHQGTPVIDEAFLTSIEEELGDAASNVGLSDPFQAFRRFLRQPSNLASIEHLGLALGEIDPASPRGVLAKILPPSAVASTLAAVPHVDKSGIGNPVARVAAARHLQAIGLYGMRRTEAEYLRDMDVQGDVIRVQPYGTHTLKTHWSERVLPRALAGIAGLSWLGNSGAEANGRLLISDQGQDVHGFNFYAHVNRLLQHEASDPEVHLHVLRHTVASRLMLSVLSKSVDYHEIFGQVPWLHEFLLPESQVEVLLGSEGQSGHGLQVIAALLGHSHPLTTLRHYIHTTGVAFYAHLCGLPRPSLLHAFENRLASPRTMQRRIHEWKKATGAAERAVAEGVIHAHLLAMVEESFPTVVAKEEPTGGSLPTINEAVTTDAVDVAVGNEEVETTHGVGYRRLEQIDGILRGDLKDNGTVDAAAIAKALERIFDIPSGKRGSTTKRHPCVVVDGRRLPVRLQAGSPTQAAARVSAWLEDLRRQDPEEVEWLLQRWLHASEQEFGRMRLDDDQSRWDQLPMSESVVPCREEKVFRRRAGSGHGDRIQHWGRIRCRSASGKWLRKDVPAVRWVMTWAAALRVAHALD